MDMNKNNGDHDCTDETLSPAGKKNSFFQTILNLDHAPSTISCSFTPLATPLNSGSLNDPILAGVINEDQAKDLFDLFFLHLNSFNNLFDPFLHSVPYVRSKCPFLFTTIIMAATKFFKPELFMACQRMAIDLAARAFVESWKHVEVVQAFTCLARWKDPGDNVSN
jgi:hypothetical protein